MVGRKLALSALTPSRKGWYDSRMPKIMIDADALLATLIDCDDDLNIDYLDFHLLIARHLTETNRDANEYLLSYDICPMHRCDAEICADDDEPECAALRS
jgi:hypothetical protein